MERGWDPRGKNGKLDVSSKVQECPSITNLTPMSSSTISKRQNIRADVMVSPVTKQALPAQVPPEGQFTLVYGGDRTPEIAEIIGAKVVVPLGNGALDVDGPLAGLVAATGDVDDFERLVEKRNRGDQIGEPIRVGRASASVPLSVKV